ncbi:MAG TPA: hypothetical protein VMG08_06965 [Allosphingosinicella sp.]|nr:hypothetical protein [Allosphingosinicella sp.]
MSGGQITAIIIVAIVMFASVVRAAFGSGKLGHRGRRGRDESLPARDDAETRRLREEVRNLKERLAVIERITVEKENSLAREIEQLRDEPRR